MDKKTQRIKVLNFRNDAMRDGWVMTEMSSNESTDERCRLSRDGFEMQVITRENHSDVHAWGPDNLAIKVKFPYDSLQLTSAVRLCDFCKLPHDKTFRVAFANRACNDCLPAAKAKLETAGWCS